MYHALLTNRYLTSRVIPLIAVAAVALCVALVIVVVSVMTGFLNMVKNSGRTLMGDVVISYPVSGIPYYDRLIDRIQKLPQTAAVTPVVDGLGLLKMPYPDDDRKRTEMVQFWGIEPASFAQVTGYADTLYWRHINPESENADERDHWKRMFGDVLDKYWKDVLSQFSDDQRIALIKVALDYEPGDTKVPDDQTIRDSLSKVPEDYWSKVFRSLHLEPKLVRQVLTPEQWQTLLAHDERLVQADAILNDGLKLQHHGDHRTIVLGMHVSDGNERNRDGTYRQLSFGYWWMPRFEVTLTTLPVTGGVGGADTAESRILQVANEFISGVYLIDDKRVMIPLDIAQDMLHLDQGEKTDDSGNTIGIDPARATLVLVRAKEGVSPEQLRDAVSDAYRDFHDEVQADAAAIEKPPSMGMGLNVQTWAEQQAQFIGPVEKEREMMRTLFSLVYIVCAGLVLAIFWAIVYEKTRDIGILRSAGASRIGVSWIFLRYGLVVGSLGSLAGFALAYVIINRINGIHEALSNPPRAVPIAVLALAFVSLVITIIKAFTRNLLPVVLGGLITAALLIAGLLALWLYLIGGFIMWDPQVYYFTKIPNEMDVPSAIVTMIGAVVFSLIGAFVPAAKAADTDPVKALRYE